VIGDARCSRSTTGTWIVFIDAAELFAERLHGLSDMGLDFRRSTRHQKARRKLTMLLHDHLRGLGNIYFDGVDNFAERYWNCLAGKRIPLAVNCSVPDQAQTQALNIELRLKLKLSSSGSESQALRERSATTKAAVVVAAAAVLKVAVAVTVAVAAAVAVAVAAAAAAAAAVAVALAAGGQLSRIFRS
jgi:hypothetical protein